VTTAYLDEAERANRVGFMNQGRLIQVDTPAGLKRSLPESIYRLTSNNQRGTREALQSQPGVLTVQPMGVDLHLFLNPAVTSPEKLQAITPFEYHKIQPSLEDVFIAMVRRQELAHAA
jgi:ABC-2 type transport system ATP-binding protein